MNYPNECEALLARLFKVSDRYSFYVFRRKGVQIDRVCDLELDRVGKWIVGLIVDIFRSSDRVAFTSSRSDTARCLRVE